MVDAENGFVFLIVGIVGAIIGGIIFILSDFSLTLTDPVEALGIGLGYGGAILAFIGFIVYVFIGEDFIKCEACGIKIKESAYYCPQCNAKNPNFYHKKFLCNLCGKRTRYDEYQGRYKYCGNLLPRV